MDLNLSFPRGDTIFSNPDFSKKVPPCKARYAASRVISLLVSARRSLIKALYRLFRSSAAFRVSGFLRRVKRVSEVARDLGCSTSAMTKWVRDYKQHGDGSFPGKGNLTPEDQRIKDLERRLRRAEMERDL